MEDGGQRRECVHVDDVARADVLALTASQPIEGAFKVCSGRPRTVGELASALAGALGGPEAVVTGNWRIGDVRHIVADPAAAANTLGFRARVPFDMSIADFAGRVTT